MKNLCLLFFSFLFIVSAVEAANQPVLLTTAEQQVTVAFDRLDTGLKKAAGKLGTTGLTGEGARQVLTEVCKQFSFAVDCATVDTKGRLTTIEPALYRGFEGTDISAQEQVKQMLKLHKPVTSQVFRSVEGYDAVDVEYPIFNPEGRFIGSVSVMFKPEKFLGEIIKPLVKGVPLDIWAMEQGGRILYDSNPAQVGLNIFTSSAYQPYKQLVLLAQKIAATPQGDGVYRFKKEHLTGPDVDKKAYWTSVSLFGVSWRLVGIHLEQNAKERISWSPAAAVTAEQALDAFAADTTLKAALTDGDKDTIMKLFGQFYKATPGIYSVQWIDSKGVNRFGFPVENSLSEYDCNAGTAASDRQFLRILNKQNPDVFEAPLFEGRTGYFVFKPVFRDGRYLGMVYTIKLKN